MLSVGRGIDPDAIFQQFDLIGRGAVVAAVSGGGDSLALLFILKGFLDRASPATRLVAVTIDHGLRADAPAEAGAVAALCQRFRVGHRTLAWTGAKPSSGLPAAAREARYRLLADAAAAEGAEVIVTGHTFEDDVETIDMRKARGHGRGLSGMAPATLYDGCVWILRPLLAVRRADLREHLRERGIAWAEDPTNDDERYERARVRLSVKSIVPDTSQTSLQAAIDTAKRQRLELGSRAAAQILVHARPAGRGLVRLDRAFGSAIDRDAAVYALRILLAATGGVEQLPDLARATALSVRLNNGNFRSTLSRTVVDARRDAVFLRRENRSLPAAASPLPGSIWDGRYRIGRLQDGATIAALGLAGAAAMLAKQGVALPAAPASLARAALAVEPALWRHGICDGLAAEADPARLDPARRIIAPWARFLPSFDLGPAKAAAALFGACIPPEPPFAGHKAGKG